MSQMEVDEDHHPLSSTITAPTAQSEPPTKRRKQNPVAAVAAAAAAGGKKADNSTKNADKMENPFGILGWLSFPDTDNCLRLLVEPTVGFWVPQANPEGTVLCTSVVAGNVVVESATESTPARTNPALLCPMRPGREEVTFRNEFPWVSAALQIPTELRTGYELMIMHFRGGNASFLKLGPQGDKTHDFGVAVRLNDLSSALNVFYFTFELEHFDFDAAAVAAGANHVTMELEFIPRTKKLLINSGGSQWVPMSFEDTAASAAYPHKRQIPLHVVRWQAVDRNKIMHKTTDLVLPKGFIESCVPRRKCKLV